VAGGGTGAEAGEAPVGTAGELVGREDHVDDDAPDEDFDGGTLRDTPSILADNIGLPGSRGLTGPSGFMGTAGFAG
jgi:hypothetical protein